MSMTTVKTLWHKPVVKRIPIETTSRQTEIKGRVGMLRRILKRVSQVVKEEWEWFKLRCWLQRHAVRFPK